MPVVSQGVLRLVAVQPPLLHQHLLGGGLAEPALHLPVTVSITASQAVLVTITQGPALQVYVDLGQLGVVRVVVVTSLAPVITVGLGVRLGVQWELEQLKPGGPHCLHTEEDQDYTHQTDSGDHLTDTTGLLCSPYLSVQCQFHNICTVSFESINYQTTGIGILPTIKL